MKNDKNNILNNFGGQGDTPTGEFSRSDLKMIESALRKQWEIPEVIFKGMPAKLAAIFANESQNTRNRLTAAKILNSLHADNRDAAKLAMQYYGIIQNETNVSVSNDHIVNQTMTEDDIRGVIDEYRRLHSKPSPDAESEISDS